MLHGVGTAQIRIMNRILDTSLTMVVIIELVPYHPVGILKDLQIFYVPTNMTSLIHMANITIMIHMTYFTHMPKITAAIVSDFMRFPIPYVMVQNLQHQNYTLTLGMLIPAMIVSETHKGSSLNITYVGLIG